MEKAFVNFSSLKSRVSLVSVMGHYGVRLRQVNQDSLRGKCPLPTHTSEKSSYSFSVSLEKELWICQSASCAAVRGGKKGGDVIDFVAAMENCSVRKAALKLQEWSADAAGLALLPNRSAPTAATRMVPEPNKPLPFELSGIVHSHPYLRRRGITLDTARTFGVGFFGGKGLMSGRVVIPIHDEKGRLVAYAGRAIDDTTPKYKLPRGFRKSQVLFNLHRVAGEHVIIVEGFFDCMKVWQAGFRNVVALMGSSLSTSQEDLLVARFREATILLDGDTAGRYATGQIEKRLLRRLHTYTLALPDESQPDSLAKAQLDNLLQSQNG